MKELSIEEKAKRYDEAIERAKSKIKNDKDHVLYESDVIDIFPELYESEDEEIRKWIIDDIRYNMNNEPLNNSEYKKKAEKAIAWLEKQGEDIDIANKEYWRGYREGKQETLDKYAELEKQGEQNTNILWHDVSEEPEKYRELLCEWYAKGDINHLTQFHDVVFYHRNDKTFWNGKQQIENVTKWAYVDEMLRKRS